MANDESAGSFNPSVRSTENSGTDPPIINDVWEEPITAEAADSQINQQHSDNRTMQQQSDQASHAT